MTSEFYENTSDIDVDAAVKCLFYLCLYNHIEKGLRNYRDVAVGGNPFGIDRVTPKGVRRVIGAAASGACAYVGATGAAAAAEGVMLGCTGAVGSVAGTTIGTTVCTAVCGYPVLVVGAGAVGAYGAWSVSKYLFNGMYYAAVNASAAVRAIAVGLADVIPGNYPDPVPVGPIVQFPPPGPPRNRPPLPAPPVNVDQPIARPPQGPPPVVQPIARPPQGPPPGAHQHPAAPQVVVPNPSVSVSPRVSIASSENIARLREMGVPAQEAQRLLENNHNNIQASIDEYFNN